MDSSGEMAFFTLPAVDGYEVQFIGSTEGDPPCICEDVSDRVFAIDLDRYTGRIIFRHGGLQDETPSRVKDQIIDQQDQNVDADSENVGENDHEVDADSQKVVSADDQESDAEGHEAHPLSNETSQVASDASTNKEAEAESGNDATESTMMIQESLLEHSREQDEAILENIQEGQTSETFDSPVLKQRKSPSILARDGSISSAGSAVSTKSKRSKANRELPPSSSRTLSSHPLFDVTPGSKKRKSSHRKNQPSSIRGLYRLKSTIPSHIREVRDFGRSYFHPSTSEDGLWFSDSGKVSNAQTLFKTLQNVNRLKWETSGKKGSLSRQNMAQLVAPPSRLHALCSASKIILEDIESELEAHPETAAVRDFRSRTPLHLLADNDQLFMDPEGRFAVSTLVLRLIQAYPEAMTTLDSTDRMPFLPLIEDWLIWVYETEEEDRLRRKADSTTNFFGFDEEIPSIQRRKFGLANPVSRAAMQVTKGATRTAARTAGHLTKGANRVMEFMNQRLHSHVDALINGNETEKEDPKSHRYKAARLYPRVQMWDEVEFAFEMLSLIFDELGGKNGGIRKDRYEAEDDASASESASGSLSLSSSSDAPMYSPDKQTRTEFADHIVTVLPYMLKTILLIEDNTFREKLLDSPLFQRLRLCPHAVGPWLTDMLRRKGIPAKRAVDYIILISRSKCEDYVGTFRSALPDDYLEYERLKHLTFAKMEESQNTIASLVVLGNKDVERAASSKIIWHVMNRNLARPFVVGLMLVDFVLHITLMLAVRASVGLESTGSASSAVGTIPTQVALFICSFYIIRKGAEALALLKLSPAVFRAHLMNMWTVLDFMTVILTLCAISWNEKNPGEFRNGFNALVVGLLWLKVLMFLKVVNKQMAIFIMAVTKILRDLRYFAIVLFVVIFTVGDMISIAIATKDDGMYCENRAESDSTVDDFCSSNQMDAYLRIYSLLLGEFELDSFRETGGMTLLFFFFTIIGVIILLNVLIAVIDDSYERAKIIGFNLFGRARVGFVAQNEALEAFLSPGKTSEDDLDLDSTQITRKAFLRVFYIGRWLVLITLIATALNAEVFHATRAVVAVRYNRNDYFNLIVAIILFIALSAGLLIMIVFAFEKVVDDFAPGCVKSGFKVFQRLSAYLVKLAGGLIFGVHETTIAGVKQIESTKSQDDEWQGRLHYMERMMEKALTRTKDDMALQLQDLERRLLEKQALLQ